MCQWSINIHILLSAVHTSSKSTWLSQQNSMNQVKTFIYEQSDKNVIRRFISLYMPILWAIFFLSQQFITQGTRADRGSYFVTLYKTCKLHEERNRKKEKKEERRKIGYNDELNTWKVAIKQSQLPNCIIECKSTAIEF